MRRTIAKSLILSAILFITAGCVRDEFSAVRNGDSLVFTATIADATRTSVKVDGTSGKVNWEDGDEILINGVTFVAEPDADNASRATFTKKNSGDADPALIDGKYYATYACTYDASKVAGELPAARTFDGADISAPMYAESAGTSLSFRNICGLLSFNLTAKTGGASVESITVSANENICGTFELKDGAASLTSGSSAVTVNCAGLALSTSEATPFHVALPKGTYTGVKFTVNFTDKGAQSFSYKNDMTVEVNNLYCVNLAVESKGGMAARYTNDGGANWTYAASLAEAVAGISSGTGKSNGIVEIFQDQANGATALPDFSGKKFTVIGHGRTWDISQRTASVTTDANTDVTFKDIVIDGKGAKATVRFLYCSKSSKITFDEGTEICNICYVKQETSGNAGNIYLAPDASVNINGAYIHDCTTSNKSTTGVITGGFLCNYGGTITMTSGTVENCTCDSKSTSTNNVGGFIYNSWDNSGEDGMINISGGTFTGCKARSGGCIYTKAGVTNISNVTISDCESYTNGGALYFGGSNTTDYAVATISNSTIKGCKAAGSGSAMMVNYSIADVTVYGCTIVSDNKECVSLAAGKCSFANTKAVNTLSGGSVFSSTTNNATSRILVSGGYYSGDAITSGSNATDNRIYISGGYFNRNTFAAGTHFINVNVESITPVQQSVDGTQYTFSYEAKKALTPEGSSYGAYKYVVILGVDGAGAWFSDQVTPNTYSIFKNGAMASDVQCATPSLSAQCWTSMLHGVPPEFHRRTNDNTGVVHFDPESPYPSIFRVIRETMPDAELASICNWDNVNYGIIEEGIGVNKQHATSDRAVTDLILKYLDSNNPTLLYVQYDSVDHEGHASGYGKTKHLASLTTVDGYIKEVYDKLSGKGILDETLFIVTADHGGTPGGSHGGATAAEMNTFLGVSGKTADKGNIVLNAEGQDVSAIVAYALGIRQPDIWTSRVPTGIFYDVEGTPRKTIEIPVSDIRKHENEPTPALSTMENLLSGHKVIAYLPFDGNADDAFGVTSTTRNGKQYYYSGYYGEGLDIQDGYVTLNDVKFGTSSFSIAFWIKVNDVNGDPCIISNKNWANGNNSGFVLSLRPDDIKFNAGNGSARMDGEAMYPLDYDKGWMHVILNVDRSSSKKVTVYYDFKEEYSFAIPSGWTTVSFDALNLNIGQDGTGSYSKKMAAQLDEMIIVRGILKDTEIAAMKEHYK